MMLTQVTILAMMATGLHSPGWSLTFHDEFDGPAGRAPSQELWSANVGGDGWGNNEKESYTKGNANAFLDGKGHLVIEARKEKTKGPDGIMCAYSSARLLTKGKFSQRYGRIEARIQLPEGKGIWPAFWMMGDNIDSVGWPQCGEIDILESVDKVVKTAYGTVHGPGYSGQNAVGGHIDFPSSLSRGFHTYAVEWEPNRIRWFVDDRRYFTVTPNEIRKQKWVFDQPFFIIMNLAIGGYWPGYPDATTQFPQRMIVDYVRAYKRAEN
ncbi:MAG: glycoside hydrolase family 16 protein [Fimbriimonas sp.]|nr:glycoside hydrolase family 16 protein [Fimbriimonas sp.]